MGQAAVQADRGLPIIIQQEERNDRVGFRPCSNRL